jgi:hypothetical protein
MLILLATLLAAAPTRDTATTGPALRSPPIQVSLNSGGNFAPGGRVSVRVETNDDGYLVVFRIDGDGHVRVLFPLDPDGDPFVRGGKEYELRGRGDHETFLADDRAGNGMVYAALSHEPLVFRDFSANGHWDYDALRLPDSTTDTENDLTNLVAQMTNRARFDYDAVGYRVQEIGPIAAVGGGGYYSGYYDPYYDPRWRCLGCGWAYPGSDIFVGLNFGYSPYWDPFLFSPWGYNYGYGYGYPRGGGWFPGTYPINPRPYRPVPPGTRSRPRPDQGSPPATGGGNVAQPQSGGGGGTRSRPQPGGGGTTTQPVVRGAPSTGNSGGIGTRARPRPVDEAVVGRDPNTSSRPVFREPLRNASAPGERSRSPEPQSRPVYREPPHVDRSPPPQARSNPQPRSAPPPAPPPATRSRPEPKKP